MFSLLCEKVALAASWAEVVSQIVFLKLLVKVL
jgi:hypothetical protein